MRELFSLEPFDFDYENETEWGISITNSVEYDVSRPFDFGVLNSWDSTIPSICNFGLSLTFENEVSQQERQKVIKSIGEKLANRLKVNVYYHRTHLGSGGNIKRDIIFK